MWTHRQTGPTHRGGLAVPGTPDPASGFSGPLPLAGGLLVVILLVVGISGTNVTQILIPTKCGLKTQFILVDDRVLKIQILMECLML